MSYNPVPPLVTDFNLAEWGRHVSLILNENLPLAYVPVTKRVTADHTVLREETYVGVTDTSSARTITLPQKMVDGSIIVVKDESGAAGTNNITVSRGGTDTIDGATSTAISSNYGAVTVISNGSGAWFTL
jgi:hypothetical protein